MFCLNGVATIREGRFSGLGCAGGKGFVWWEGRKYNWKKLTQAETSRLIPRKYDND